MECKIIRLEIILFFTTWFFGIGLLIFSTKITSENALEYGMLFAVIMYVFGFISNSLTLPFHYQELLRLGEISSRLKE